MTSDYFYTLLGKKIAGDITPKEADELDNAIRENNSFAIIASYWSKIGSISISRVSNGGNIKALLAAKIESENRKKRRFIFAQRIAASVLFAIAAFSITYYCSFRTSYTLVAETHIGQNCKTVLEDGSIVWLNSESRLYVENKFNKRDRKVKLEGEGYFEVAKNPSKSFVVGLKDGCAVKVHGTKFDISAYVNDSFVKTSVTSGKVSFGDSKNKVFLTANQTATYLSKNNSLKKEEINTQSFTEWKEGKLVFSALPLEQIKNILERKFGSKVIIRDPDLLKLQLSGKFTNESLATILNLLSLTNRIQVSEKKDVYYITKKNF